MEQRSGIPAEPQAEPTVSKSTAEIAAQALAAFAGVAVSRYLGLELTITLLAGAAGGALCGLLPYSVAKKRNNLQAGRISMWVCTGSGLVLGILLALPVALLATVAVVAASRADAPASVAEALAEDRADRF